MNIASGDGTSLLDLINILSDINSKMKAPEFTESRAGDIHTSLADTSLLLNTIQVGDLISIKEGLS